MVMEKDSVHKRTYPSILVETDVVWKLYRQWIENGRSLFSALQNQQTPDKLSYSKLKENKYFFFRTKKSTT